MLFFQNVRTSRFSFTLQELSISDARELLNIPANLIEKGRGEFLRRAIKEIVWNKDQSRVDLGELTVQERLFIESIYLSACQENSDFHLGNGRLSDYLMFEKHYRDGFDKVELGQFDGEVIFGRVLTGNLIEIIEQRLTAEKAERLDWLVYSMAACLYSDNSSLLNTKDPIEIGNIIEERAKNIFDMPERKFLALLEMFFVFLEKTRHFFCINFDDKGVIKMPIEKEDGRELNPARFPSDAKFTFNTQILLGKFEQNGKWSSDTV